jgi:hypothetical protein
MKEDEYSFRVDKETGNVVVDVLKPNGKETLTMQEFEELIKKKNLPIDEKKIAVDKLSKFNMALKKGLDWNPKKKS